MSPTQPPASKLPHHTLSGACSTRWCAELRAQKSLASAAGVGSARVATRRAAPAPEALAALCDTYQGMFELVCYDAGACSAHNAEFVGERGPHYLFALTAAQPTLLEEAKRWLGPRPIAEADATTEDVERGQVVTRRLYLGAATAAPDGWQSLRTVLRVETEIIKHGKLVSRDGRTPSGRRPHSHPIARFRQPQPSAR